MTNTTRDSILETTVSKRPLSEPQSDARPNPKGDVGRRARREPAKPSASWFGSGPQRDFRFYPSRNCLSLVVPID